MDTPTIETIQSLVKRQHDADEVWISLKSHFNDPSTEAEMRAYQASSEISEELLEAYHSIKQAWKDASDDDRLNPSPEAAAKALSAYRTYITSRKLIKRILPGFEVLYQL